MNAWLADQPIPQPHPKYRLRVWRETHASLAPLKNELIAYVQEALDDARKRIRAGFEDDLSPFNDPAHDPAANYPAMLNQISLKGYFGETLAALAVEHFGALGHTDWQVPALLFRFHDQEFQHLELINDRLLAGTIHEPDAVAERQPGRTGDDGLAFRINDAGVITDILTLEAKCLSESNTATMSDAQASSPLRHMLEALKSAWMGLTGGGTDEAFAAWLDLTAVASADLETVAAAHEYLDSLDAFLIASVQEIEELLTVEVEGAELEAELTAIWRRTYAFAASHGEAQLAAIWLARGRAIKRHYPDPIERRRLYRTSLSPRSGRFLLDRAETIRTKLAEGHDYARWNSEQQLAFVQGILSLLSEIPSFQIRKVLGRKKDFDDWPKILRWWLAKTTLTRQPKSTEVTNWFSFVADNFIYRGSWGLGSVIGLLLDSAEDGQPVRALEIDDWPKTGLPWIAFWLKELLSWGTIDPVAAFLLARGDAIDRPQAEAEAMAYYQTRRDEADANATLDPRVIREWVEARKPVYPTRTSPTMTVVETALVRPASDFRQGRLSVSPLDDQGSLSWIDPAGYEVARSKEPDGWSQQPSQFQFELHIATGYVFGEPNLPHR